MQKALEKLGASEQADPGAVLETVAMASISTVGGAAGPRYGTLQERRRGVRGLRGTHGEIRSSTGPGNDKLAGDGVRPFGPRGLGLAEGARADLSEAGLGRARRDGDLGALPGGA